MRCGLASDIFIGIYRRKVWTKDRSLGQVPARRPALIPEIRSSKDMSKIESKLKELGLALPPPMQVPAGVALPFPWVNVRGDRVLISGHGPQNADGSLAGPFGKVGGDVTPDEGRELA